jgi:hypothetical protein
VMRVAIAGKDDEQFLGDQETPPLQAAAGQAPTDSPAADAKPLTIPASTGPAAKATRQPSASTPSQPSLGAKPGAKPAVQAQPVPDKHPDTVKPALPNKT